MASESSSKPQTECTATPVPGSVVKGEPNLLVSVLGWLQSLNSKDMARYPVWFVVTLKRRKSIEGGNHP